MTLEQAMRRVVDPCFGADGKLLRNWWPGFSEDAEVAFAGARWVLDFGAGVGRNTRHILTLNDKAHVVAYEPDAPTRAWILPYVACGPVLESGQKPEKPDNGHEKLWQRTHLAAIQSDTLGPLYDVALTATVLQHNKIAVRKELVQFFAQIIRPGGYLITAERRKADDNTTTLEVFDSAGDLFEVVSKHRSGTGEWGIHDEIVWRRK